ncbi:UMP kinase [Candidatus Saccharibacteria bacterium]|nr:UMP kinase [Candidatus Saccharibacteria bacterium]
MNSHKRVLLKLSGEQLANKQGTGIDPEFVDWLASEIKKVTEAGIQLVIVVGGGNFLRGATFAGGGIERSTADYMGMMATIINGMALVDMIEAHGQPTRLQTNLRIQQVAEPFIRRRALRHLEKGRVVIIGGGIGKPYLTTDTAATSIALELDCDVILKATKVDGIYDKDPHKFDNARKLHSLTFQQAVESDAIKVMDKAALGLAMEQNMSIVVFDLMQDGNILKAANGEKIGTKVS